MTADEIRKQSAEAIDSIYRDHEDKQAEATVAAMEALYEIAAQLAELTQFLRSCKEDLTTNGCIDVMNRTV